MLTDVIKYFCLSVGILVLAYKIIEWEFPNIHNYIVSLWHFYITKKLGHPIHFRLYNTLTKQLKALEESGKRKYEQRFLRMLLKHAGRFKSKMAGKYDHKRKLKVWKNGKKFSNYGRRRKRQQAT